MPRNHWPRLLAALALAASFIAAAGGGHALAAQLPYAQLVVSKGAPCTSSTGGVYTTIQAAVSAAPTTGARIVVCPGTYREQVTLLYQQNINLVSYVAYKAVIQAPATWSTTNCNASPCGHYIVGFDYYSVNDSISGFTITGPGAANTTGDCNQGIQAGIGVTYYSSVSIQRNHITKIYDSNQATTGLLNGSGVQVGSRDDPTCAYDPYGGDEPGYATIFNNTIDNYGRDGVLVTAESGPAQADVEYNTITGGGSTGFANNGIETDSYAGLTANRNVITHNLCGPSGACPNAYDVVGGGIIYAFLYAEAESTTFVVTNNIDGVFVNGNGSGVRITGNNANYNSQAGISLYDVFGPVVKNNTASDASGATLGSNGNGSTFGYGDGLFLNNGTYYGTVSSNTFNSNIDDGILADRRVYYITFSHNTALANETTDAVDQSPGTGTAGTDDYWIGNLCKTSSPTGLCNT